MRTFQEFITLKEDYSDNNSPDYLSEKALAAAQQAFEMVLSNKSSAAIDFLNHMSEILPEIKTVLQQHGLDKFEDGDFKSGMKSKKRIVKGLADVSPDDVKDGADVIAGNSSDSFHNPLG